MKRGRAERVFYISLCTQDTIRKRSEDAMAVEPLKPAPSGYAMAEIPRHNIGLQPPAFRVPTSIESFECRDGSAGNDLRCIFERSTVTVI